MPREKRGGRIFDLSKSNNLPMNLRIQGYKEAWKMPVKIGETPASGTLSMFQNLIESAFLFVFSKRMGCKKTQLAFEMSARVMRRILDWTFSC
jgi:hypothetical protein